jgi:hypothetical protein
VEGVTSNEGKLLLVVEAVIVGKAIEPITTTDLRTTVMSSLFLQASSFSIAPSKIEISAE